MAERRETAAATQRLRGGPGLAAEPADSAPNGDHPAAVRGDRSRWANLPAVILIMMLAYGVLGGAFTAVYQYTRPAVYASNASLLIDQRGAEFAVGNEGVIAKLSRLRVKYTSLVGTETFAEPVAKQAGLPVATVRGALTATAVPNTMLVVVSARSSTATRAHTIAQAAADYLSGYIRSEQSAVGVKAKDQVTLSVVTPAGGGVRVAPSHKKALLEGAAVFAAFAVAGALAADLLRRRRRS